MAVKGRQTAFLVCIAALAATGAVVAYVASSLHAAKTTLPKNRVIVLDHSIGPVWLGESRTSLQNALGPGRRRQRCVAAYFGGRLVVDFCPKEDPTNNVAAIWTSWGGFHTRSGLRIGASRQQAASISGMSCGVGLCTHYLRPRHADGAVTEVTTRHGRVTKIRVFFG
jgi:hypothetical protein